jgi:hypothetical protein
LVVSCYCLPPRRLAPSLKQSTGLFLNARPLKGEQKVGGYGFSVISYQL